MGSWRTLSETQIAELGAKLTGLRWSWSARDVPRVAAELGWPVVAGPSSGGAILQTGYEPFNGLAEMVFIGSDVHKLDVYRLMVELTDATTEQTRESVEYRREVFATAARVLTGTVGTPSRRRPGAQPEIWWTVPDAVLRLSDNATFVELALFSPRYAWKLDDEHGTAETPDAELDEDES